MGAFIAFIFSLIALGIAIKIIKWILKKISIGAKTIFPIIFLAFYLWFLIEYTGITLWITGGIAVLIVIAAKIHQNEKSKIAKKVLPIIKANDFSGLRKIYLAYTNSQKNILINIITRSGLIYQNNLIENLFRGDLLDVFKKNMDSKTGICLMERKEFESCFNIIWENRVQQGIVQFAKEMLPERFDLDDSIEFQNQKNKDKIIRLIKISIRQDKDPFEGAIELD